MQIETTPLTIIIPKAHLANVIGQYLYAIEALSKEDTIQYLDVPVDIDENDNITVTVGILKEVIN